MGTGSEDGLIQRLQPTQIETVGVLSSRSSGGKEDNSECSLQRYPKSKCTPAPRAAGHSWATWKRTKACNVALNHWRQSPIIILHSLDLAFFMSLFLVLPVLTLNDTEQRPRKWGTWFSKWPSTFIFSVGTRGLESKNIFQCSMLVFIQSSKAIAFRGKYTPTDAS